MDTTRNSQANQRSKAAEASPEGEKELRQLVDALPQHIVALDGDGRRLHANQVVLDYHGLTLEEFLFEESPHKCFHPEDLEKYRGLRQSGMTSKAPWDAEVRLRRNDGKYRWFLLRAKPLLDEQGRAVRWYVTGTDIEDRKVAERELQRRTETQAVFQKLVNSSMDGILAFDKEGRYTVWNPALARIFGIDESQRLGQKASDLCPFFRQTGGKNCYADAIGGKGVIARDIPYVFAETGKQIFLDGHFSPLLDDGGNIIGGLAIIRDVTERKWAEKEIQQLVDAVPQTIIVLATDGRRLYPNKVTLDFFGWTLEDFADDNKVRQGFHPDDLASFYDKRERGISSGVPFKIEARILRNDSQYRWFLFMYNPYRNGQGDIVKWYSTGTDIQDRKEAEDALRRSESYLAEAQRLSHTGSFAHDPIRGEITYWSAESYRTFGFDPAMGPISYAEARSRVHPDDLQGFDDYRERGIREKTGVEIDFRLLLPDGSIKNVHCISRPVVNASGEVVELVGTNMDVTEQHQSRTTLEKAFEEIKQLKDELYKENLALREEIDQASMFEEIVGSSEPLRRVLIQVTKVAPTDSTVLIAGETGTGKELIARAIHKRSPRSSRTFVSVNCAAIPVTLIGSELFGHERGAFTGATARRLGRFELAEGGTLFLDEVGDLPAETQIALLRVLQERRLERIGGNQSIAVNVRIIAATNRDLKAAIKTGTFRSDLFYRLNVFPIDVPALRERKEDIPLLVEYLTERYASKAGKKIKHVARRTLELFQAYDWPGNIRELQNVIERAVILCDGETLSVDEVWLQHESPRPTEDGKRLARLGTDQEKELIESALATSKGRVSGPSGAAARLGVPRSTLETKIKTLRINKHRFRT